MSKKLNVELHKKTSYEDMSLYPLTYSSNVITGNDEYLDSVLKTQKNKNAKYDKTLLSIDGVETRLKQYVDNSLENKVSLIIGNEVPSSLSDNIIFGLLVD